MRKIIYVMALISLIILSLKVTGKSGIQEDSIRFRIIANSNNINDQNIKYLIKKELENQFFPLLNNINSIEEARNVITDNQKIIDNIIQKYNVTYEIEYGNNYFPTKIYNDYVYDEGIYESLVISLGESKGNNWWCVMYPPLCLIDDTSNNYEDVEYKLYISEIMENKG